MTIRIASFALGCFVPVPCAGCGLSADPRWPVSGLCPGCRTILAAALPEEAAVPGQPGTRLLWALRYHDPTARLIIDFKNHHRVDLAGVLAGPLAKTIASTGFDAPLLVPIPGRTAGFRRRGYHPVEVLIRRSGHVPTRMLEWARTPRDQLGLDPHERAENLAGALRVRVRGGGREPELPPGDGEDKADPPPRENRALLKTSPIWVVDDVCTSGATLREAVRVLRLARLPVAGALVLARAERENRAVRQPRAGPSLVASYALVLCCGQRVRLAGTDGSSVASARLEYARIMRGHGDRWAI